MPLHDFIAVDYNVYTSDCLAQSIYLNHLNNEKKEANENLKIYLLDIDCPRNENIGTISSKTETKLRSYESLQDLAP